MARYKFKVGDKVIGKGCSVNCRRPYLRNLYCTVVSVCGGYVVVRWDKKFNDANIDSKNGKLPFCKSRFRLLQEGCQLLLFDI